MAGAVEVVMVCDRCGKPITTKTRHVVSLLGTKQDHFGKDRSYKRTVEVCGQCVQLVKSALNLHGTAK